MKLSRRTFMGVLGTAPITAGMVAKHTIETTTIPSVGALGRGLVGGSESCKPVQGHVVGSRPVWTFVEYLTGDRLRHLKARAAREAMTLDPDLLYWNVPLTTKVREQKSRNLKRLIDLERQEFDSTLSRFGEVRVWD